MKLFKIKFDSGKNDVITILPPQFVPGYVIFTLNERTSIAVPQSNVGAFNYTYIDKDNPNYSILKAKVKNK